MAKQNQVAEAKSDKKSRPKVEPTVVEELSDDLAGLAKLPGGPIAAVGGGTIQAQAARLGDRRLQGAQRQALAAQIGRVQGNQYLQRVIASVKGETKTTSYLQRQIIRGEEEQKKVPETKKEAEKKKPSASDKATLEAALKKVDDMIRTARKVSGGKYAAENLEYWKSKKSGTKKMPASAFQNHKFIIEWLREKPRTMFLKGAGKRLKSGELFSGGTAKMYWIDSVYAPEGNPLFYALGGFTIRSDVVVKAKTFSPEEGGGDLVSFVSWTCQAFDDYNWDKLKSTFIPLYGKISDDELRVLEKYGYGKSFKIESEPWTVTDSQCLQEVAIE